MHGHLRQNELPVFGAKTLGVYEGTLDMHGDRFILTFHIRFAKKASRDSQKPSS